MDCKIFNLTLCKCGTTSIEYIFVEYLAKKKFPYMTSFYPNENLLNDFFCKKDYSVMDNFIEKYNFFSDIPFCVKDYYKYLDKTYKNAKFILMVRDKNTWSESFEKWLDLTKKNTNGEFDLIGKYYWETNFNNEIKDYKFINKNNILKLYDDYNNHIIEYFKNKNNLLILKLENQNNISKINDFFNTNLTIDFPKMNINNNI
jgi:hypothetical protein